MQYLVSRLKEPSTWAGLAALASAFGLTVSDDLTQAISALGVAIGGLLAVFLAEKK